MVVNDKGTVACQGEEKADEGPRRRALTLRVVVLASVWLILLARINWVGLSDLVPSIDSSLAPSPAGIAIMLLPMVLNVIAIRLFANKAEKRKWFSEREIILLYSMVMTGGVVVSYRVIWFLIQLVGLPTNVVYDPGLWKPYMERISQLVLVENLQAVMGFWMGNAAVPWAEWLVPLIIWALFWFVLLFMIMCTVSLVYTQWADRERLNFPLVTPVVALVGISKSELAIDEKVPFWKNRLTWLGILVPVGFYGLRLLSNYFPVIPTFSGIILTPANLVGAEGPVAQATHIHVSLREWRFDPLQWGIAYLIDLEMSFSIWFISLVFYIWRIFVAATGHISYYQSTRYDPVSLGLGASVGIALTALWVSRYHLRDMIRKAFGNNSIDDSNEPLPAKVAFWGLVVSYILLVIFTVVFLRTGIITALVYFIIFLLTTLATARFRAQAGIPLLNATGDYWFSRSIFLAVKGNKEFAIQSTGIMHYGPLEYGAVNMVGANIMESYKFSDVAGINKKEASIALYIALVIAVIAMLIVGVITSYGIGASNYGTVTANAGTLAHHSNMTTSLPKEGTEHALAVSRWIWYLVGSGGVFILSFLRSQFVWWPVHPLGLLLGTHHFVWGLSWHWSIFSVWVIKVIIRRVGGFEIEKTIRPFFVAMVVGSAVMLLVQSLVPLLVNML